MGLEELFANPAEFRRNDPEFFSFLVGVTQGIL